METNHLETRSFGNKCFGNTGVWFRFALTSATPIWTPKAAFASATLIWAPRAASASANSFRNLTYKVILSLVRQGAV